jgi:hypothetical protein
VLDGTSAIPDGSIIASNGPAGPASREGDSSCIVDLNILGSNVIARGGLGVGIGSGFGKYTMSRRSSRAFLSAIAEL